MAIGRVCSIHNEWCADGNCRWCEPLPVQAHPAIAPRAVSGAVFMGAILKEFDSSPPQTNTTASAAGIAYWPWIVW